MISEKKKYFTDLLIITVISAVFYGILGIFYMLLKIDLSKLPILVQTIIGAVFEFGIMGLGITVICVRNKESFASFGLHKEKFPPAVLLSALLCLPAFLYILISKGSVTWFPLQNVNFTIPVLSSGFPVNVTGMLIILAVWGFFEGFSYVVIADRINRLFPPKNLFLNRGAVICGILCLVLHILVGYSYDMFEALADFVLIYGMLVIQSYTKNAWGYVLIFCFFWSAVGY